MTGDKVAGFVASAGMALLLGTYIHDGQRWELALGIFCGFVWLGLWLGQRE